MKIFTIVDYKFPVIGCFFLFFAVIFYWIGLSIPKNKMIFQLGKTFIFFSNFLFSLTLFLRWIGDGYFPLSNLYESLLFLTWGVSSTQLYLESKTKSRLLGSISTPILFFLSGFSSFTLPIEMQKALPLVPSLQSNWLMMHVSMMMISYATLILGSLLSIFYLAFSNFFSKDFQLAIPNLLEIVDIWSYRIIGLGFPFLTVGIISGAVWANEAWGSYWSWDPKETWAFITWSAFSIYLHSRLLKNWEGKKAGFLGLCGFFAIWICYLGVNFLGKGLHSYGWVF